jgi:hypothetical protein
MSIVPIGQKTTPPTHKQTRADLRARMELGA